MSATRLAFAITAVTFLACIVAQVFLAGLAVFGGRLDFEAHRGFGYVFGWLTVIMLVLAIAGRLGRERIMISALLLVLFAMQSVFVLVRADLPWVAALHPVNALAMFWLTWRLVSRVMAVTARHVTDDAGPVATGVGVITVASVASLAAFFTIGEPFGVINDILNAAIGVGSAVLAVRLRPHARSVVALAIIGAGIAAVGAALVISSTTGFFLAGQVSSVGFALIGIWLLAANRSLAATGGLELRLTTLGTITGGIMILGLLTAPGIAAGIDSMETAPVWLWIGYMGWLGVYVLYPVWAIWLGRTRLA